MADYGTVTWINGKPSIVGPNGARLFLSPITAAQYSDPQMQAWAKSQGAQIYAPSAIPGAYQTNPDGTRVPVMETKADTGAPSNTALTSYQWNPDTGEYDRSIDWGTIAALGLTGALTGGALAAALGGPAAAGTGGAATAGTSGGTAVGTSAAPLAASAIPTTLGIDAATAAALPGATALGTGAAGLGTAGSVLAGTDAATAIPAGAAALPASAAPVLGTLANTGSNLLGNSNLWKAIAGIAAPVVGGVIQSNAANTAAAAQQAALNKALAQQQQQYDTTRGDLAPYRTLGESSGARLKTLLGLS